MTFFPSARPAFCGSHEGFRLTKSKSSKAFFTFTFLVYWKTVLSEIPSHNLYFPISRVYQKTKMGNLDLQFRSKSKIDSLLSVYSSILRYSSILKIYACTAQLYHFLESFATILTNNIYVQMSVRQER